MRLVPAGAVAGRRPSAGLRRTARLAAGLGAVLLAAGCSAASGQAASSSSARAITVAVVPGIGNAPLRLGQQERLFASAGITVAIRDFSSVAAELKALEAGQVDIADGDYGALFAAQSQAEQARSAGFSIVADGYDAATGVTEVLTLPSSSITSSAQLANQQIAVPDTDQLAAPAGGNPVSLATAATIPVLQTYGVAQATVRWDPMSPQAELTALGDGSVKAILVPEPYVFQAESKFGAMEVLDSYSGSTAGLPLSGYFAMKSWSLDHQAAVADFRAGLSQAQEDAAMTGPVQHILPGYAGLTAQEAALVTIGSYPTATNANNLQRVAQLLWEDGALRSAVVVAPMMAR